MAALTDQTITVYRGESVIQPFTMSPVEDITGWTLKFTVTKSPDKTAKILGPLAVTIDNAALGKFHVTLLEEQTNLRAGTYRWDVWRTDEGFEQVKAIGDLVVLGDSRVPPIEP